MDYAKFDRVMIQAAVRDENALERLRLLLEVARRRHLDTIIEGVETKEHVQLVLDLGVRRVQGFYWDLPEQVHEARPNVRAISAFRDALQA